MAAADPARKSSWLLPGCVAAAWLLFALMVVTISWGAAASRNRPFDLVNTVAWNLGWLFWAGATFGVRRLAQRFPLERQSLGRRLLLHVGFGLLITILMLVFEFLVNAQLGRLWPGPIRPFQLSAFVVYKFHIYFLVYWLIAGASGAYDFYAKLQRTELIAAQLETQLAQAQVQALKMQLHPHFLFNTHHAIISLMLKNENPSAIKMLTQLSDLLRLTLKQAERPMNALAEELEMLELYLGIQRERYRERLQVVIDVTPDVLGAEIPCLMLQPLVENALQHGIDPRAAGGRVTIHVHRENERLEIRIDDNGEGLPPGFKLEVQNGVGLSNTRARLQRLYGTQQQFLMAPAEGGGTVARISLPFRVFSGADELSAT
jgi:two-component system LytT family sensor kinase